MRRRKARTMRKWQIKYKAREEEEAEKGEKRMKYEDK